MSALKNVLHGFIKDCFRWRVEYGLCGSPAGTEVLIDRSLFVSFCGRRVSIFCQLSFDSDNSPFPLKASITSHNLLPFNGYPLSSNP